MSADSTRSTDARISPTAHYTGYVWVRNGLSDPAFATPEGRVFYHALQPPMSILRRTGQPALEGFLVARHRMIDHLLTEAIEQGTVTQVIEVAAGLSARGWRFTQRYGDGITYLEADLPGMAERKRRLLARSGKGGPHVVDVDALADGGPHSIAELTASLDTGKGLAIITEGLINYFDQDTVTALWARFARALDPFAHGLYLSDLVMQRSAPRVLSRVARTLLSTFVRGEVHQHFTTRDEVTDALSEAGFTGADVHNPAGFAATLGLRDIRSAATVRVIAARTSAGQH